MSSFIAKLRFKLLCSDAAQFGHSFAIPLTSGPPFFQLQPRISAPSKNGPSFGGRTLEGPRSRGPICPYLFPILFSPRRWTSLLLAAFKLIALLSLVTRLAQLHSTTLLLES